MSRSALEEDREAFKAIHEALEIGRFNSQEIWEMPGKVWMRALSALARLEGPRLDGLTYSTKTKTMGNVQPNKETCLMFDTPVLESDFDALTKDLTRFFSHLVERTKEFNADSTDDVTRKVSRIETYHDEISHLLDKAYEAGC